MIWIFDLYRLTSLSLSATEVNLGFPVTQFPLTTPGVVQCPQDLSCLAPQRRASVPQRKLIEPDHRAS